MFSRSGKPVYSRYGSEESLVTKFGVMQALVSFYEDDDDVVKLVLVCTYYVFFNWQYAIHR